MGVGIATTLKRRDQLAGSLKPGLPLAVFFSDLSTDLHRSSFFLFVFNFFAGFFFSWIAFYVFQFLSKWLPFQINSFASQILVAFDQRTSLHFKPSLPFSGC